MKIKILIVTLFVLLIFQLSAFSVNQYQNQGVSPVATYTGNIGIVVISYSNAWNSEEQLKKIYDELMSNTHGTEIEYLSTIYIYPDSKDGVGSYYYDGYSKGKNGKYIYKYDRTIVIYNGDQYTDISQISRILSHEYGHHFTFFYLLTQENLEKNKWLDSEYAQVRGLDDYHQITYLGDQTCEYNHKWDIAEILAEDYVQLYGSPMAKSTRDYYDVKERINYKTGSYFFYYHDFNLLPQENLDIPLAADVKGLPEYFVELSGVSLSNNPEYLHIYSPYITQINAVYKGFNEYVIEWTQTYSDFQNSRFEYTLVMNTRSSNDYPIPLKTVSDREKLTCVAGSGVDETKERGVFKNYEGEYELRLFVQDSYGFMHSSPITEISIAQKDNEQASPFEGDPKQTLQPNATNNLSNRTIYFRE